MNYSQKPRIFEENFNSAGSLSLSFNFNFLKKSTVSLLIFLLFTAPFLNVNAQISENLQINEPLNQPELVIEPLLNQEEVINSALEKNINLQENITDKNVDANIENIKIATDPNLELNVTASSGSSFNIYTLNDSVVKKNSNPIFPETESNTGALVYNLPIRLPPGRLGMEPKIGLKYSNQNKLEESLVGFGWEISGIEYIERLNKNGTDAMYRKMDITSSMNGELVETSANIFNAKTVNGDFITYIFDPLTNSFSATDKNGKQYIFGLSATSRQDSPTDSSKIYKWMIEEIKDANGNAIKFEYFKDQGQVYPSKIFYTANGADLGIFSVEFIREPANYPVKSYRRAFLTTTAQRIKAIEVKINNILYGNIQLSFTNGQNGNRQMLASVSESYMNEGGVWVNLSPTIFEYQKNYNPPQAWQNTNWENINFNLPTFRYRNPLQTIDQSFGGFIWMPGSDVGDFNGDSKPDVALAAAAQCGGCVVQTMTYLRNGSSFYASPELSLPIYLYDGFGNPGNVILTDLNGDGLTDVASDNSYLNTGSGFLRNEAYKGAVWNDAFLRPGLMDLNGDSLPDFYHMVLVPGQGIYRNAFFRNTGKGFFDDLLLSPESPNRDFIYYGDLNGDGLTDILSSSHRLAGWEPESWSKNSSLNTGNQEWKEADEFFSPVIFDERWANGSKKNPREHIFADINGDGLVDILSPYALYQSTGNGWKHIEHPINVPNLGVLDINADGMPDVTDVYGNAWLNKQLPPDILTKITLPEGGSATITYKPSSQTVNTKLPYVVQVVDKITKNDNKGNTTSNTFVYENGFHFFDPQKPLDRKFAGFEKITNTNSKGNKVVSYFHQGNGDNLSANEANDHFSKIGRLYKTEIYNSNNQLFSQKINKWVNFDLGQDKNFVKLEQVASLQYDGNSSHKDTAQNFVYDNVNGNLLQQIDWGEVNASSDGNFTDVSLDKTTVNFTYASSSLIPNYYVITSEIKTDFNNSKVKENKYYYDNLLFGQIQKGNLTKTENWQSGLVYINTQTSYNSYGLPTLKKDANGKNTTFAYDSFNLYPTSITNPLNQIFIYLYDYSSGKIKETLDQNEFKTQTTYDGIGRTLEIKQSKLNNPIELIGKNAYVYTNTSGNWSIKQTVYLDDLNSVESYSYLDGFGRVIQERKETENSNTFSVVDTFYDENGQVNKKSLPYFSDGFTLTPFLVAPEIFTIYNFDALDRVSTIENSIGIVSNIYDDWKQIITDPNGKQKNLYFDGYNRLAKVEELESGNIFSTNYEYDANGNLLKITDALGNVRNFTFDGLSRKLSAEDLHSVLDTTFGKYLYTYDANGNLTKLVDPKGQNILYIYDNLNRVVSENFTGLTGIETSFVYDTCLNGKGRVCSINYSGVLTSFEYDLAGNKTKETKKINSIDYITIYSYDIQGNIITIKNPDNSIIQYSYNTSGQLETVKNKESSQTNFSNILLNIDYGPHGLITKQDYGNGLTTENVYDQSKQFRLTSKRTISASSTPQNLAYEYDNNGNILKITDASTTNTAKIVNYIYDDLNRLKTASSTGASFGGNYVNNFSYDALGNLLTKTHNNTATNYLYQGNLLSNFANPHAPTKVGSYTQTYDRNGNLTADGVLTHTWNYKNELVKTTKNLTIQLPGLASFYPISGDGSIYNHSTTSWDSVHDALSGSVSTNTDTGLRVSSGKNSTNNQKIERTFIPFNTSALPDSASIVSAKLKLFTHSKLNNDNDGDDWITLVQTSQASTTSLNIQDYDLAGSINRPIEGIDIAERKDITNIPLNQYQTLTLNATGRTWISKTGFTKLGLREGHDVIDSPFVGLANQSNQITFRSSEYTSTSTDPILEINYTYPSTTPLTNTFVYDHSGQRVMHTVATATTTKTTYYPSKFYNISSSLPTKHIFAGDMLIATITGSNASSTVNYIHTDHLGGTNVVTSDTGNVVELIDYYPYGSMRLDERTGSFDEKRKFIGEIYDGDTGLNYLNARYYNGNNAKFISQDPMFWTIPQEYLIDPQQWNSYSYARNNPIINLDPTGLYNIKSGEVEKGDTQNSIVSSINSAFGINTNWETVHNVSFYNDRFGDKSLSDIVGKNLYIGTDITTNITSQLNQLNKNRSEIASQLGKGSLINYAPGQAWDIKNSNDPVLGGGQNNRQYWSYIYNGELIRYDAPGNINFGYVARSLGLSSSVIQGGARAQQIIDNKANNRSGGWGDNSGDLKYIQKGINTYKATLPWYKRILPW